MNDRVHAALDRIYREIPGGFCKGLCQEACGPCSMTKAEMDRCVAHAEPVRNPSDELQCPFLNPENGRCRVYAVRPIVCRIYGASKAIPCPHGCRPSKMLSPRQARKLMARVRALGGPEVSTHDELHVLIKDAFREATEAGLTSGQARELIRRTLDGGTDYTPKGGTTK